MLLLKALEIVITFAVMDNFNYYIAPLSSSPTVSPDHTSSSFIRLIID